jgi:PEGA domain
MRSRVIAPVLIAGLIALALPGSGEARGGDRGGGGHFSGGGRVGSAGHPGRVGSGGHSGRVGSGGHPGRSPYVGHGGPGNHFRHYRHGVPFDYGLPYEWRGGIGWGGPFLGFPLWWDAYWGWDWPYGYYGSYGPYGYYGSYDYDGYPYSVVFRVPPYGGEAGAGTAEVAAEATNVPAAAVPGTSAVDLQVSPPTALVLLNGVLIGSVDEFGHGSDYLYLDAGEYTLEFRAPGYLARTLRLSVTGGEQALVSLDLQVDPAATGHTAAPPSPGLPHGRRFAPDFGPATSQSEPPGGPAADPQSAALVLQVSPPDAAVYVDGALVGTGENLAQIEEGVEVSPGPHRIDVVAPGHTGKTLQVDVKAGKTVKLSIALD